MVIDDEMKKKLALLIQEKIKQDFESVHLTGNLMNSIHIEQSGDSILINVDAPTYDISRFKKEGVIVYNGLGSYAQEVDDTGGFSGKHKDYIERAINDAINDWMSFYGIKGRIL